MFSLDLVRHPTIVRNDPRSKGSPTCKGTMAKQTHRRRSTQHIFTAQCRERIGPPANPKHANHIDTHVATHPARREQRRESASEGSLNGTNSVHPCCDSTTTKKRWAASVRRVGCVIACVCVWVGGGECMCVCTTHGTLPTYDQIIPKHTPLEEGLGGGIDRENKGRNEIGKARDRERERDR